MINFKPAVLSVAALLGLSLAPSLKADPWNKKTVLMAQNTVVQTAPEAAPYQHPEASVMTSAKTLPSTASSLPLMGLVGLASLGAFGLLVCLPKPKFGLAYCRRD